MKKAATANLETTELHDEANPIYLFNRTWTELLTRIVSGELDAREIAWQELRQRGFDEKGNWVGFGDGKVARPF